MSKIFTDVTSGWKILWSWNSGPNKVCSGQSEAAGRGKGGSLQTSTDLFCIATKFRGREGLAWRAHSVEQMNAPAPQCGVHTSPQATCESNAAGNELVSSPSLIGIKQQFLKTVFVVGKRVFRPNGGREDKYTLFWFFKTQLFCLEHRCKKACQQIFHRLCQCCVRSSVLFFSSQQRSHPGVVWHNTSYYLLSQRPPSKSPLPQYGAPMMPQAPLLATLCLFKAFLWTIAN